MQVDTPDLSAASLWLRHALAPLLFFCVAAALLEATHFDLEIARTLFFDGVTQRWSGAGVWWVNEFVHTGGRWGMRILGALGLSLWLATFVFRPLENLRRACGYFVLAVGLTVGVVGLLKALTNVDCPWDLLGFGGEHPYVALFADRPDGLPRGRCFPAAHASSGYALMALYFVAYERSRRWAVLGLGTGLLLGLIFGVAQQSRGAHFVSHDLWSAFLAWIIPLSLYAFVFRARLYGRSG